MDRLRIAVTVVVRTALVATVVVAGIALVRTINIQDTQCKSGRDARIVLRQIIRYSTRPTPPAFARALHLSPVVAKIANQRAADLRAYALARLPIHPCDPGQH